MSTNWDTCFSSLPQDTERRIFHSSIGVHLLWNFILDRSEIEIHRNATWVSVTRESCAGLIERRHRSGSRWPGQN
jgi:hypothetical protein